MPTPELAVLLRTCKHSEIDITSRRNSIPDKFGYALKCDNVSISYAKTPIQVPIPQQSPQLIDIGVYRPSVSLSGLVETVGGNTPTVDQSTNLSAAIVAVDATTVNVDSASGMVIGDVINVTDMYEAGGTYVDDYPDNHDYGDDTDDTDTNINNNDALWGVNKR